MEMSLVQWVLAHKPVILRAVWMPVQIFISAHAAGVQILQS